MNSLLEHTNADGFQKTGSKCCFFATSFFFSSSLLFLGGKRHKNAQQNLYWWNNCFPTHLQLRDLLTILLRYLHYFCTIIFECVRGEGDRECMRAIECVWGRWSGCEGDRECMRAIEWVWGRQSVCEGDRVCCEGDREYVRLRARESFVLVWGVWGSIN